MEKYGKILCGAIQIPAIYPSYIKIENRKIFNPSPQQYKSAGYVPIIETLPPATSENEEAVASYQYVNYHTQILQQWSVCPIEV